MDVSLDGDIIMGTMASQITNLTIVYSTVYSIADQRKHQSSASLAFMWGIHRWPVNSPHKWPVTRKMFPFDDVIIQSFDSHQVNWWRLISSIILDRRTKDDMTIISEQIISLITGTNDEELKIPYFWYTDGIVNGTAISLLYDYPDSKFHGADTGAIWGRHDPVGLMLAPWTLLSGFNEHGWNSLRAPYTPGTICYGVSVTRNLTPNKPQAMV